MTAGVQYNVIMVTYFLATSLAQDLMKMKAFTLRLNSTGGQVCARPTNVPSAVISMKALAAGGSVMMKCGAQCTASSMCRLYQYRSDIALCELYDYWPSNFTAIDKCKAYGVPQSIPDSRIRLVGGHSNYEGRVEIFHDGLWGTVCDDFFEAVDAGVVCASLGFSRNGTVVPLAGFGRGANPIWLDDVACSGGESSLVECGNRGWGITSCLHTEDVGVICSP